MPKKIRNPFDITKEFYVVRPFKFGGKTWEPGDENSTFPWRRIGCTERELYRFWDVRLLECKSDANIEGVNYPTALQSSQKKEEIVNTEPELVEEPEPEPELDEEPELVEDKEVSTAKAKKPKAGKNSK